jgi:hypothetical protein
LSASGVRSGPIRDTLPPELAVSGSRLPRLHVDAVDPTEAGALGDGPKRGALAVAIRRCPPQSLLVDRDGADLPMETSARASGGRLGQSPPYRGTLPGRTRASFTRSTTSRRPRHRPGISGRRRHFRISRSVAGGRCAPFRGRCRAGVPRDARVLAASGCPRGPGRVVWGGRGTLGR